MLIGTLYPLLLEVMTGDKISVGAPFFNMTFGPLMIPLLLQFRSVRCSPGNAVIFTACRSG